MGEKDREFAISVLEFLVKKFREAMNTRGNYNAINMAITNYQLGLSLEGMSKEEEDKIYLEAKIRATKKQIEKYEEKLKTIEGKSN